MRENSLPKKFLLQPLYLFLVGLFLAGITAKASADFNQDYQNYVTIYDTYRSLHAKYLTTRNQYLTFGTLASKNEALEAGKAFVSARDDVLIAYFGLLRQRSTDPAYSALVDQEIQFLTSHKAKITGLADLDDLVRVSQEVEERHIEIQLTAKKTLGMIIISKLEGIRNQSLALQNEARGLNETLRTQGKDVSLLERWLLDTKNKQLLADESIARAKNEIVELDRSSIDRLNQDYTEIQSTFFVANQYLREAGNFLGELIETIKYGDY